MSSEKNSKLEKQNDCKVSSLLDLPECFLDCILEYLSPLDLCRVAQVCTYLRDKIRSDALWERQIKQKWGRLLGDVALQEWQCHTTKIINIQSFFLRYNQGECIFFSGVWPFLSVHSHLENFIDLIGLFKSCSKMALYICLDSGRFWFPVQVYKNACLFCYDGIVCYDSGTNTFRATRFPTNNPRMIEENVKWERLRISPVETSPMAFYMSNCMNDLKPGDQIEIQMKRRKYFPYYWRYGIVGHLESCDKEVNHCHCQYNDMLVVEFKIYHSQSRWTRSVLNRNVYEEQETEIYWFGGIRKLDKEEEIEWWKNNLFASR